MHNGGEGEGGSYRLSPIIITFDSLVTGMVGTVQKSDLWSDLGSYLKSEYLGHLGLPFFTSLNHQKYRACWYINKICSHVCPTVLCEFCQFPQGGAWHPYLPGAGPATIPEKAKSRRFWEILKQFGGNYDFFVGINEFGQICKKLWRALNQLLHTMPMFP